MVENLKDLEKLLKLCRKQGVVEMDLGSVKIKLGDLPLDPNKSIAYEDPDYKDPYANFPQGELTPEQLIHYSSGGSPEDDPFLKDEQN